MAFMAISRKVLSVSSGLFSDEVLETMETPLGVSQASTVALNDKTSPGVVKVSYASWLCAEPGFRAGTYVQSPSCH